MGHGVVLPARRAVCLRLVVRGALLWLLVAALVVPGLWPGAWAALQLLMLGSVDGVSRGLSGVLVPLRPVRVVVGAGGAPATVVVTGRGASSRALHRYLRDRDVPRAVRGTLRLAGFELDVEPHRVAPLVRKLSLLGCEPSRRPLARDGASTDRPG
ncbi:hypothetical protein [Isoptericola sp. NPDC057559]|uniref:hypothetical protein n=1 Tax=Isoptericola sp. NPDC057559 TaxID=3346168 RepID=UPI00367608DC